MLGEFQDAVFDIVEIVALSIEILAVTIIVIAVFVGLAGYIQHAFSSRAFVDERFTAYRMVLARALLLGLELLVAADIVKTVVLDPSLESVAVLGLLVLIRIFLGWSLIVEMEGRWPWQGKPAEEKQEQGVKTEAL